MRTRNPVAIVKEYLEPAEPMQVRKNAVSALAALNDPDSLATLAEIAITDVDPQVREHAEMELASLPAESVTQTLPRIFADLRDPKKRRDAYALLGRLRSHGVPFRFPSLGIVTRLLLVRSLRVRNPQRGFRFLLRKIKNMSVGMLLAYVMSLFYVASMIQVDLRVEFVGSYFGFCIVAWILTLTIVTLGLRLTSPVRHHADVVGAALLDMLMVAAVTAALNATVIFIDLYEEPHKSRDGIGMMLWLVPFAAVAVRGGTLAAFGMSRGRRMNHVAQVIVGGLCGLAVYELCAIVSGKMATRVVSLGWFWIVLGTFGLAGAFAGIDGQAEPAPVTSRPIRVVALALASITVLIGLVSMIPVRETQITVGPIQQFPYSVVLRNVPATITYTDGDTDVTLDDMTRYVVIKNQLPGQPVYARIVRKEVSTPDDAWNYLLDIGKLLTWTQLKARLLRAEPVDGPALVNVSIVRRALPSSSLAKPPEAFAKQLR